MRNDFTKCSYLRFILRTESLNSLCKFQLEALGVKCLDDGGAYEAYGIIDDDERTDELTEVSDIVSIEESAPPSAK